MSREVIEEAIVIVSLPIFKTLELNLARLLAFSDVDFFPKVGDIVGIDRIENEKL